MVTKQHDDANKKDLEHKPDSEVKHEVTAEDDEPIDISTGDDVDIDEDNSVSDIGTNEPPPRAP